MTEKATGKVTYIKMAEIVLKRAVNQRLKSLIWEVIHTAVSSGDIRRLRIKSGHF